MKDKLEIITPLKADRRDAKNKPRMQKHGVSLKRPNKHAGMLIVKKSK